MQIQLQDVGFVRSVGRRFYGSSGLFAGASITVVERAGEIEIHVGNGFATMLCLGWRDDAAFIVERFTDRQYRSGAVADLGDALTSQVRRFVTRHGLISHRRSWRKKLKSIDAVIDNRAYASRPRDF